MPRHGIDAVVDDAKHYVEGLAQECGVHYGGTATEAWTSIRPYSTRPTKRILAQVDVDSAPLLGVEDPFVFSAGGTSGDSSESARSLAGRWTEFSASS